MREPTWVLEATARAVHRRQLAEHGGGDGVRDDALLASALDKPRNLFHYTGDKANLSALAAAYAAGISGNHPFVDGNKRTAFVVCLLFLKLNGTELNATQAEKYQMFWGLAAGDISEQKLANWISANLANSSTKS